ncbi:MAG: hypothetical protein AAB510_01185 [Patescibacteria group bacterium]
MAIISTFITMSKAFKETTIQADLLQSSNILERISREVRQAYDINFISATDLRLNTIESNNRTIILRFVLSGYNIQVYQDDVFIGNLNIPSIEVTSLSFTQITTAQGKGVRITLSTRSNRDSLSRTYDFYSTAALRGSY